LISESSDGDPVGGPEGKMYDALEGNKLEDVASLVKYILGVRLERAGGTVWHDQASWGGGRCERWRLKQGPGHPVCKPPRT